MKLKPVTTLNGETTWCGPSVISSITGFPVALIVRVIKDQRTKRGVGYNERWINLPYDTKIIRAERPVRGTHDHEVNECLKHYGYRLVGSANRIIGYRDHKNNPQRPTLAKWLKQRKDRNELTLINAGCHWVLVRGVKFVDSFTQVPVFIRKAPHRRKRVLQVYKVERFGKRKLYRS